jgi:hypothetical protein
MSTPRSHSAGNVGKYTCMRCGWRWTPRLNAPDPPRACARCRSAYWQSAPLSSRANFPQDPKWQAERESVARRRHLQRLRELAAEFNLKPTPVIDGPGIGLSLVPATEPSQPSMLRVNPRAHANETDASEPSPPVAPAPRRSLAEELHRRIAAYAKTDAET